MEKGQIIARIEDSDVHAALVQARASKAVAEADLLTAEQTLRREKTLWEKNLVTQAEYETQSRSMPGSRLPSKLLKPVLRGRKLRWKIR